MRINSSTHKVLASVGCSETKLMTLIVNDESRVTNLVSEHPTLANIFILMQIASLLNVVVVEVNRASISIVVVVVV
jgi:hypothetical protein